MPPVRPFPSADKVILSPRNPRVGAVARLGKRRERDRRSLFVAEGVWALQSALDACVTLHEVWFCQAMLPDTSAALLEQARRMGAALVETSVDAMRRISFREGPDGILTVLPYLQTSLDDMPVTSPPLVLVAEAIEKPGNLGAMVRTACASGADGVVVCDPTTDPLGPGVVRASLGTLFHLPVAVTSPDRTIRWLRDHAISIVAATPQATVAHWETDLRGPSAIAIGNEHRGLSERWLQEADVAVRIPMPGPINSLNATTAAAILLFEALRQRTRQMTDG